MKKTTMFLLVILILMHCSIDAFANEPVLVSADDVVIMSGQTVSVPVRIENNIGIMGFKISVNYSVEKLDIKSITRGDITDKGNFNTNFGINDGRFDVLWNNTEDIKSNGVLFTINARAVSEIKGDTEIELSYSQPDTFNENYDDVVLDCKSISVSFSESNAENNSEATSAQVNDETHDETTYDNSHILIAIKETLSEYGYTSLSEINADNQDYFLAAVNERLSVLSDGKYADIDSFDNLVSLYNSAYEGVFISGITSDISRENIQKSINSALKSVGAENISDVKDGEKQKFIKSLENNLKSYSNNVLPISEDVDSNTAVDIIQKIAGSGSSEIESDAPENVVSADTCLAIVGCIIVLVAGAAVIISLIIKKRRKNEK